MATTDETKAARTETAASRERKVEHDKEQASLPGSISSDSSVGEPIGNLSDKRQKKIVEQRKETQKVYAQVAKDAEKLREESAKEAVKQAAEAAKEQIEEHGAWKWPDEPLPGELPPYSTAREAEDAEKAESSDADAS